VLQLEHAQAVPLELLVRAATQRPLAGGVRLCALLFQIFIVQLCGRYAVRVHVNLQGFDAVRELRRRGAAAQWSDRYRPNPPCRSPEIRTDLRSAARPRSLVLDAGG
jgi:hypothetical protein